MKRTLFIFLLIIVLPLQTHSQRQNTEDTFSALTRPDTVMASSSKDSIQSTQPDSVSLSSHFVAEKIIEDAKKLLSTPYLYGANGPKAFDCSAFTRYIYKRYGYKLARSAKGQATDGRVVEGNLSDLQKGDILIFGSRSKPEVIGHVGIFMNLDSTGTSFSFIHAAHGGVKITELKDSYYKQRFLGARRILPDFIRAIPESENDTLTIDSMSVVVFKDTLTLQENDQRIILFGDGKWVYVNDSGEMMSPSGDDRILLSFDGNWLKIENSKVKIPIAREELKSTGNQSTAVPLYHIIRKGDNLSKLAAKYHTTVATLCRLNGIEATTTLREGRKLKIR